MLYRRKNSHRWWVRFTAPDGREIRRTTDTENKKDAEEFEAKLKQDIWRQSRLGERSIRTWQEAVIRWIEETSSKASHEDDLYHLRWIDQYCIAGISDWNRSTGRCCALSRRPARPRA